MKKLPYRQIHLDFHTSEFISGIGEKFDKKQFQDALKLGHVNSITVFAKCHHGWSYHPTTANEMHPHLKFDLVAAQLEACREIGVRAPVYISAGYDDKYAREHPEDLILYSLGGGYSFWDMPHFHLLCFNTPYLDRLVEQTEEVMQRYNPEALFLDISGPRVCYCHRCMKSMAEKGLDYKKPEDVKKHGELVFLEYLRRIKEAVHKYNKDTAIFHNNGHVIRGRRDFVEYQDHLELESLPTGGWGYDHFPMSAAYSRLLGKEYLGMTGKFHTTWGGFGEFKHPNALRYEAALSIALGAKCSIGDQLHPSGEMNMVTYRLIGKAYAEVEAKEPYVDNCEAISDIAIMSAEAFAPESGVSAPYDTGASRILLEGKYQYDIIDQYVDITRYKLLILPDVVRIDGELKAKLEAYVANGGKILCSGKSGLYKDSDKFALDLGVTYEGQNEFTPSYMIPEYDTVSGRTEYIIHHNAANVKLTSGSVEAMLAEPYFNRTCEHYCSHRQTPNKPGTERVGAVINGSTAYIAWDIFKNYAENGAYYAKELVLHMIDKLLPDAQKSIITNLPDRAVVTYTKQAKNSRYIAHLLFAHTTIRGIKTEVIEDIVPLYNITLAAALPSEPKRVYKAEYVDGKIVKTDIPFTYENGKAHLTVDKVDMHAMVVFDI